MAKINELISGIVLLLILGYVIYNEFFRSYTEHEVKVEYIEIIDTHYVDNPIPYKVEVPVEVEVEMWDTLKLTDTVIVKEYITDLLTEFNTSRHYLDTLDLDTLGIITASTLVYQNKLQYINFGVGLKIPEYTIIRQPRPTFGMGIMGGYKNVSTIISYDRNRVTTFAGYNYIRNELSVGAIYNFRR